jgi:hypothetical protein
MRTIEYNGFTIQELPNGWWEVRVGSQFVKFDSLSYAISRIDYWTK